MGQRPCQGDEWRVDAEAETAERQGGVLVLSCLALSCLVFCWQAALSCPSALPINALIYLGAALSWGSSVRGGEGCKGMRLFRKRWSFGLDWRPGLAAASVHPSGGAWRNSPLTGGCSF